MTDMTQEQLDNWRRLLMTAYGIPSFMLKDDKVIERIRDNFQAQVNAIKPKKEFCDCEGIQGTTTHRDGSVTCNKCGLKKV